jgi:hypothetical protein
MSMTTTPQPAAAAATSAARTGHWYRRFTPAERVLHVFMMLSFVGLALTGLPLIFADHHGFNGSSAGRKFVDYGNVEVAIDRHRQRTRDRSGRHDKDVGIETESL